MNRPAPTSTSPHAITADLVPQPARLSFALVSDAKLPHSIFEGLSADITLISRGRGIAPLLAPGFDAILFDLGSADCADFETLGRVINLGPRVPVLALFERHAFTPDRAYEAVHLGAEDACLFDAFNAGSVVVSATLAITRFQRREPTDTAAAHSCAITKTPNAASGQAPVTIIQEAADAMIILDNEGKVAFANSAAAELLGRPLETLAGKHLDMPTVPGDRSIHITHPSGEERFADLRIVETEWGGQPARVAALTDTTVRRQLEKTMREAEKKSLTSERRSSSFFSNVNHDLRTPLTHIIGFSELMKDEQFGPLGERYREYASDIHQSGTMLLDMIEDLLSVAESETDAISLSDDICHLDALIETVVSSQKKNAFEANITLVATQSPNLPGFRGDAKRLRQGLFRLISELLHTNDAGARIELGAEVCAGGLIIKAVVDTKDGGALALPYDDFETGSACSHVEDPFVSAEGLRLPRDTSLALSLTRKIAELHGGALRVGHDPQGKPAVILSLPAARIIR
ncbi:MAG: hypothetical protein COA62_06405 [Rhodobiaceae bacterium]|nr:MAG: hypothetical protein COA62_06405 [Rhodobiaceae bacterium]